MNTDRHGVRPSFAIPTWSHSPPRGGDNDRMMMIISWCCCCCSIFLLLLRTRYCLVDKVPIQFPRTGFTCMSCPRCLLEILRNIGHVLHRGAFLRFLLFGSRFSLDMYSIHLGSSSQLIDWLTDWPLVSFLSHIFFCAIFWHCWCGHEGTIITYRMVMLMMSDDYVD